MKKICILNYGSGNVGSIKNLLDYLGHNAIISNNKEDIRNSSHIILPGVGSFGSSVNKIKENIPLNVLENEIKNHGKPILGICVGMQVMAEIGYENGKENGLGWINGCVRKLNSGNLPLPHIGWNNIKKNRDNALIDELYDIDDFYFLHSYFFELEEKYVVSETNYYSNFCSIMNYKNIYGVQFHPEKSQKAGQKLINNFVNLK
ncbi:imidazole glycerol phosphate synthase subunit HisH [bacterium]|nr:imidazole glycerol phosphate synthase subunit HisH [bacterium]